MDIPDLTEISNCADVVVDGVPGVVIDGQFFPRVQCCRNGKRTERS
jgi:hypothetical protein